MRFFRRCRLPPDSGYGTETGDLGAFSKVTILAGPNNSGKSRLLRLFSDDKTSWAVDHSGSADIRKHLGWVGARIAQALDSALVGQHNADQIRSILHRAAHIDSDGWQIAEAVALLYEVAEVDVNTIGLPKGHVWRSSGREQTVRRVRDIAASRAAAVRALSEGESSMQGRFVYIPVLRSGRFRWDILEQKTAENPVREPQPRDALTELAVDDYFGRNRGVKVFSGSSIYFDIRARLLGDLEERRAVAEFQSFLSEQFFDGASVAIIPKLKDRQIHIKLGDERERPLAHLGDGIQSVIICTYLAFVETQPTVFLIEEPEMYLHPGFQRKLLRFFLGRQEHQFFLTTHSNHLLDMQADHLGVSIFRVTKTPGSSTPSEPEFEVAPVAGGDRSVLDDLGVLNSSVFLVNCTIWVEGITDRLYIRKFLELFWISTERERRPAEDLQFSFIEYSGANIRHWRFGETNGQPDERIGAARICGDALVIADLDGGDKRWRDAPLRAELGERFVLLNVREIENLLTPNTLWQVIQSYHRGLELGEMPRFSQASYRVKPLGRFINELLKKHELETRPGGYAEPSGTLKRKADFAGRALAGLRSWEDLSPDAQELTRRIAEFIDSKNPAS